MRYAVVIESGTGNFSAYVSDLSGCIATGKTLEEETEIESGLREGEEVVSIGSFHLKSVALSGQIGEEE